MAVSLAGTRFSSISYTKETSTERVVPVVASAPSNRVVTYPEGRYELSGEWDVRRPVLLGMDPSGSTTAPPPPARDSAFVSGRGRARPRGLDGRRESASIICGPCHR